MTEPIEAADYPATPAAPARPRSSRGVWQALAVGVLVATALGMTLLTWALALLFMLGLFFFMLFGLLIGACMYRAGRSAMPMRRRTVVLITLGAALAGWGVAVSKECLEFPRDFAFRVIDKRKYDGRNRIYIPPVEHGVEQVTQQVRAFAAAHLLEHYPPGGVIGYVRYMSSGDAIAMNLPGQPRTITVPPPALPWVWWTRVLLSLPLLFLTIYSVTSGLARSPEQADRIRVNAGPGEGAADAPPTEEQSSAPAERSRPG